MCIHTLEYYAVNKKDRTALNVLTGIISKMYWNIKTRCKCLLPFIREGKKNMHSISLAASRKGHWWPEDQRWKEIYF